MVFQIVSLLLEVVVGLVAGTCLLRLYMQQQGIPLSVRYNPLGRFVFALTDWIVLPLRRLLPSMGRLDTASLVAAFLLELAQFALLWLLSGARPLIGGIDLSPLVLLLILQVAVIVVGHLQNAVMF